MKRVDELIRSEELKVGDLVTVASRIIVTGQKMSYLADDFDSYSRGERIAIRDDNLIAAYMMKFPIPVYGGGPCIYDEECVISGTLQKSLDEFELVDIKSCIVKHSDVVVDVPFPSQPL